MNPSLSIFSKTTLGHSLWKVKANFKLYATIYHIANNMELSYGKVYRILKRICSHCLPSLIYSNFIPKESKFMICSFNCSSTKFSRRHDFNSSYISFSYIILLAKNYFLTVSVTDKPGPISIHDGHMIGTYLLISFNYLALHIDFNFTKTQLATNCE